MDNRQGGGLSHLRGVLLLASAKPRTLPNLQPAPRHSASRNLYKYITYQYKRY